ncbi:MAG TPA: amino acid ABC transporter permease [Pseudolabrys sp.]|jgi:His/Glu/Gln/Arg/opine family amino acid ABC transporter permease subunit
MNYHFDWTPIWAARGLIVEGLLMTIAVSAVSLAFSTVIGLVVGGAATAGSRAVRGLALLFTETMRNIPLLIHMYIWYMALAFLRLPAFSCAVLGLSLYSGAYVAEVVRAGIGAVGRGQMQSALATGLTRFQAMRYIVYPQALRMIAPSLASLFSQLIKDSSLASVIAVGELTYQAGAIDGQTFRTFEVYITISLIYLVLVTAASQLVLLIPGSRSDLAAGRFADA